MNNYDRAWIALWFFWLSGIQAVMSPSHNVRSVGILITLGSIAAIIAMSLRGNRKNNARRTKKD